LKTRFPPLFKKRYFLIYRICRYTGLVQQPDKIVVRFALTIYPYSLGDVLLNGSHKEKL